MGMSALAADHPADVQEAFFPIFFERAVIITVNCKTGTMPAARAYEPVELEGVDDIVISFLC